VTDKEGQLLGIDERFSLVESPSVEIPFWGAGEKLREGGVLYRKEGNGLEVH